MAGNDDRGAFSAPPGGTGIPPASGGPVDTSVLDGVGSDSFTETTHVSFGRKLMESIVGIGFGVFLVLAMAVLLFWNEGRAVQTSRSLSEGASLVVKADAARVEVANEGRLVHVEGDLAAEAPVADTAFGVQTRAARLVRHVEMFQWKEESRTETRKNLGGSEERSTTYTYSRVWENKRIDSSRFRNSDAHQNPPMRFSGYQGTARDATLGAFRPGAPALSRIPADEAKPIPPQAAGQFRGRSDLGPSHVVDGALYLGANPSDPHIGDLRVTYTIAPLGPTSFIGRQVGADLQEYQTQAGDALLLARTGLAPPEVMFEQAQAENRILTWVLRLVGAVFMWLGFGLILRPLAVVGDVVPLVGSILGAGAALVALLLTLVVAPIVVAIAWFVFRPLVSLAVLAIGAALAFGLRALAARRAAAKRGVFAPTTVAA